ncbi:Murein-DD-endopeptidase [Thauera aromatica K172]|uniref:Murein-DD-endopeptidase n=2 Tax=Thauera aromatica TaxID=59405 RepID=A0A2R4BKE6_THAAR|nr:D-alanyl-D-alanine endopeptidase [Thauera aromatica]AVR87805.1 Murein-DD-endopeptidase [Thauera aromatica K172]
MRHKILGVAFAALFALQSGAVDAASTGASSAPTSKQVVAKKSVKSNPAKPAPKRAVTKKKSRAKATKSAATKSAAVRVAAKKTMIAAPAAAAVDPESAADALPALGSSAFYVVNQNTGEVLLERNAGAVLPIASITKLMTAMVVLDGGQSLSERLTVTAEDIDHLKGTGSRLSLGTALTREEMLNLALMSSENRAASALARNYPGGEPAFIEAMNVKARLLGLWSTRFSDSTGLNPANVSSPRDLARLVSAASSYALIREFSTAPERYVDVRGHSMRFGNTNALVKSPEWAISVSKTGYISEAGRCLVMQTWLHQQPVVMVLMDSAGRYTRTADAKRVRKWLEHMLPQRLASAPHVSGG